MPHLTMRMRYLAERPAVRSYSKQYREVVDALTPHGWTQYRRYMVNLKGPPQWPT